MNNDPCTGSNSNNILLSLREWLVALVIFVVIVIATPILWRHSEKPKPSFPDYRVP